ncbi:uncharacterized protein BO66DRAFT_453155 [Aspergillus aculeatinus CBS 121060]|uniref:Uncharacterized protein n=1 Tax=Aspergillus aculeatinus CBS 121060 TaxID=1448322 RepID=A0ACD1H6E9_9EURO|nr:hypothetical protein BO66DRAFT_453155 [Aspergillus aculeatinus CBS 121060]RAH69211.1 hypothetical protein BO66DRAFT_453155 [Aspergillus aculeatinus CBS 121060]
MDSKDTVKGRACLPLNLYQEWDDEEDLAYKNILVSLVEGDLDPSEAARQIDAVLLQRYAARYDLLRSRPNPYQLTPEEVARGLTSIHQVASSAWCQVKMIFQWIAVLCSACPPGHPAQDRIILFLEALRAMPLHHVRCLGPKSNEGKDVEPFEEMPLWPLGKNWCGSADAFRREVPPCAYRCTQRNLKARAGRMTCDEEHFRWRNFQSAIARITVLGLVECRFLCSLENIIPGGRQYASSKTTAIACDLFAGVQWILLHGEYVYAECKKRDKVTDPVRQMWSMERWGLWKQLFLRIVSGEIRRFDMDIKQQAELALLRMTAWEEGESVRC